MRNSKKSSGPQLVENFQRAFLGVAGQRNQHVIDTFLAHVLEILEYGDERDPAMRAHLEKISPVNNVEKITVPMFVVQGQNDPRVPVTESEQVVEALRKQGQMVWYMNALNEGHGYRKKENRDLYQQATAYCGETCDLSIVTF